MNKPTIAYAETSLPTTSQAEQLAAIRHWEIALEVANQGNVSVETYQRNQIQIVAVQAYLMHEFHPLHPDPTHHLQAKLHVEDTLELAARLNAPRVVTVCGFGYDLVDNPFERSLDFFAALADRAKALGIRMMIEPLSPKRAGAMTKPDQVVHLLECLNQPTVFSLLLDTGHLLDSDLDLPNFFSTWHYPVEELQLKGSNSTPPDLAMPVEHWLAAMPIPPQVICVEHRQPVSWEGFEQIMSRLKNL